MKCQIGTNKRDVEFLEVYLKKLIRKYEQLLELSPHDTYLSPCDDCKIVNPEDERVARIADDYGFDGSLYRDIIVDDDLFSIQYAKRFRKKIDTIPQIIAAIEKPLDKSIIHNDAELLTIPQVARILQCGESVVRERDKKGLLPLPIRIGGTIQWRKTELKEWIGAKCPVREKWELMRQGKEVA